MKKILILLIALISVSVYSQSTIRKGFNAVQNNDTVSLIYSGGIWTLSSDTTFNITADTFAITSIELKDSVITGVYSGTLVNDTYVTNSIGTLNFTNGLVRDGNDVKWGDTLIESTSIELDGNTLNFDGITGNLFIGANSGVNNFGVYPNYLELSGTITSSFGTNTSPGGGILSMNATDNIFRDYKAGGSQTGLKYYADYQDLTALSLTHVSYVGGMIEDSIASISLNSGNISLQYMPTGAVLYEVNDTSGGSSNFTYNLNTLKLTSSIGDTALHVTSNYSKSIVIDVADGSSTGLLINNAGNPASGIKIESPSDGTGIYGLLGGNGAMIAIENTSTSGASFVSSCTTNGGIGIRLNQTASSPAIDIDPFTGANSLLDIGQISGGLKSLHVLCDSGLSDIPFYFNEKVVTPAMYADSVITKKITSPNDSIIFEKKIVAPQYIGQLYVDGDSTLSIGVADTYYTFRKFQTDLTINTTLTDSTITTTTSGYYKICNSSSYTHGTISTIIHHSVFVNDVEATQIETQRKIGTGGDVGNSSNSGILFLNTGDIVKIKFRADNTGTITVSHMNFHIFRL